LALADRNTIFKVNRHVDVAGDLVDAVIKGGVGNDREQQNCQGDTHHGYGCNGQPNIPAKTNNAVLNNPLKSDKPVCLHQAIPRIAMFNGQCLMINALLH
jgi:hypothetical protein